MRQNRLDLSFTKFETVQFMLYKGIIAHFFLFAKYLLYSYCTGYCHICEKRLEW